MTFKRLAVMTMCLLLHGTLAAQVGPSIQGKGMWIWKLWLANGGNLTTVIDKLKTAGVSWVIIKMADSDSYYNASGKALNTWAGGYGGMDSVVSAFHQNGIKLLGYQYIYGAPQYGSGPSESDVAAMILSVNGIDGLVIDAEIEFDTLPDRVNVSQNYMDNIRFSYPVSFVALSSWARVVGHSTFPWVQFLSQSTVNMPQTYWAARPISPQTELSRMSSDFTTYTQTWVSQGHPDADKPIMPTGQAEYFGYSNDVQAGEIANFCSASQSAYLYQGVSLWEYSQIAHSYVWDEYTAAWALSSVSDDAGPPVDFELLQNYPNPFNPETEIRYQLPVNGHVRLLVFDMLGREIALLADGQKPAGRYVARWNATGFPSGVYFYRLEAGLVSQTRKLVLTK